MFSQNASCDGMKREKSASLQAAIPFAANAKTAFVALQAERIDLYQIHWAPG